MKKFFLYTLLALLFVGFMNRCNPLQTQTPPYPPPEVNACSKLGTKSSPRYIYIVDIFEMQYGETKIVSDSRQFNMSLSMTITGISDNMLADCGKAKDRWKKNVVFRFEHGDSLLWNLTTNTDTVHVETISFSPCGAWEYRNDGTDLREIQDSVAAWYNKYGNDTYCMLNTLTRWEGGGGRLARLSQKNDPYGPDKHLSIYMSKVYPFSGQAKQEDYRFVFIVTTE
jgi:hypothetical protein